MFRASPLAKCALLDIIARRPGMRPRHARMARIAMASIRLRVLLASKVTIAELDQLLLHRLLAPPGATVLAEPDLAVSSYVRQGRIEVLLEQAPRVIA
jgi:hypothetical protein